MKLSSLRSLIHEGLSVVPDWIVNAHPEEILATAQSHGTWLPHSMGWQMARMVVWSGGRRGARLTLFHVEGQVDPSCHRGFLYPDGAQFVVCCGEVTLNNQKIGPGGSFSVEPGGSIAPAHQPGTVVLAYWKRPPEPRCC